MDAADDPPTAEDPPGLPDGGNGATGDADRTPGGPVRSTYDRIAEHFSATREYAWPEIDEFLSAHVPAGATRALDLGCGNGRHAEHLAEHVERVVGVDVSRGMLRQAGERARSREFPLDRVQADAGSLPFRPGTFDLVVYVATLHHLRSRAARRRSLDEVARVLAPGGRGLVSAWSTTHDRFDAEEGFDTTVDWTLPGGETVPRFYHIYDPEEFRADLDASALAVRERFVASGNCYAVVSVGDDTT